MQQSIFPEMGNSRKEESGIIRISGSKKLLSKEQQAFNKLTARISNLQKKIKETENRMADLSGYYQKTVYSKVLNLSALKIELAHLIDNKRNEVKLSKKNNELLDAVIMELLDDALSIAEPDEETKALYEKYNEPGDEDSMKEQFIDFVKNQFGFSIDPELLTGDPDFAKIQASFQEQMGEKNKNTSTRKKTKKQQEKADEEEQKETVKNKSLRSIYLSLAKILHPDGETNEQIRVEKEEMMKKVTVSYSKKDMMELLRLEMQWVNTHENNLADVDNDTIKIYIQLLKDQIKELENSLFSVGLNPAYAKVASLAIYPQSTAKREIGKIATGYDAYNNKVSADIEELKQGSKTRNTLLYCIEEYYDDFEETNFDMDFFDNDFEDKRGKKSSRNSF